MINKTIVLLANSRKHGGRCLAGREITLAREWGNWIRPVSLRTSEELNLLERRYADGTDPAVLDIIDVPLIKANGHACHTENWLISPQHQWVKKGQLSWNDAAQLVETPLVLWVNGDRTYGGQNNKISEKLSNELQSSICIILVSSLIIRVDKGFSGEKKIYANFRHQGVNYTLLVTDSIYEPIFNDRPFNHEENFGESLLTISLSEPYEKQENARFKLVAAIIPK